MIRQAKVNSLIITGTDNIHRISKSDKWRLTNFATAENSMLMHTYCQQDIHTEAWILPDRSVKNQIYHLSIQARHKSNTLDIKSCRAADNDSHHYLKSQIQAENFPEKDQSCSKSVRYNLYLLKEEEMVAKNYQSSSAQVPQKEYSTQINEEWPAIKGASTHSAQKSTVAVQNQKCNSRFDDVCK